MRTRTFAASPLALALTVFGCSGSSHTATPAPAPEPTVSATHADVDAGPPAAEADVPAAVAQAVDAGPPPEAPMPPMPEGLHGPATPWARMTAQQKGRYMGESVMPAMTALLQAYDPAHFAQVTCATCHGANAREVHFHMPNTLPALPAFGTPAAQQRMAAERRMYEFMGTRVRPAMSQLLGLPPFDPQTRQGFGCFGCHPHEGAGTPAAAGPTAAPTR